MKNLSDRCHSINLCSFILCQMVALHKKIAVRPGLSRFFIWRSVPTCDHKPTRSPTAQSCRPLCLSSGRKVCWLLPVTGVVEINSQLGWVVKCVALEKMIIPLRHYLKYFLQDSADVYIIASALRANSILARLWGFRQNVYWACYFFLCWRIVWGTTQCENKWHTQIS